MLAIYLEAIPNNTLVTLESKVIKRGGPSFPFLDTKREAYFEALHSDQFFSLNIAETLTKMVKDTVQSLKLENDKLKDKIQEIFGELQNLRDEVKAGRNGGQANSSEVTEEEITTATPSNIQEDFKRYVNDKMSLIEKSVKHLSSQVDKISSSLDQVLEYSYSYNIKLVGVPELKQRESADETLQLCMRIFSSIGAEIHPYDLDIAHRVPFRNATDGRPKPIICKFTRRIARDRVMASRREVTRINPAVIGLRENSSLDRAAIYDHLSPRLQSLLSDAKKIKERYRFSFCWAKNSTIWLRKNESSRPVAIKNSSDLSTLTARLGSSGDDTAP